MYIQSISLNSKIMAGLHKDSSLCGEHQLLLKGILAVLFCICTLSVVSFIGPIATFTCLDIILSVYLVCLFRGKLRYLFLIHPVVVYLSSFGFQIPFDMIGVGYTYINTFAALVDPGTLSLDAEKLIEELFLGDNRIFGFGTVYVGSLPSLWFPSLLFRNAPDITLYFSQSFFSLLYTALAVNVSLFYRVIRKDVLVIIALYSTVSPTFFEMNASLHRYSILFLGLFLFLISFIALRRKTVGFRSIPLISLLLLGILLVGFSKAPLFLSIILFVILDGLVHSKYFLISSSLDEKRKINRYFFYIVAVVLVAAFLSVMVPHKYALDISQRGGQYHVITNIPFAGLILRLIYAILSPFPWINFTQMDIYGYNTLFLGVHILSSLIAAWIILSFFVRIKLILRSGDDIRVPAIFGIALICSLAFSSIGYHVYLAPALPFMAPILVEKANRISPIYPIGFCAFFEFIAHIARMI